uniref:WLM domain-containing protein n=1 Tax=Pseudo-nitzschia australis TaxID=44445 RepID=A0A7S4AGF4_9STRA
MAPKNHRIVSLDDINQRKLTAPSNATWSFFSSIGSQSRDVPNEYSYCKPIGQGYGPPPNQRHAVPLHTIPGLPQNDVCVTTLERIHKEFFPIIKRRGFNVVSISELCCCGDGLDHAVNKGRKRSKCRPIGNNVLGYNRTTFGRIKSHSIHLRLRRPRDHQLIPWEDVAGTMAHELSHCVHQNHGAGFYKLMEEILEEHAVARVHGLSGPSYLRPTNVDTIQQQNKRGWGATMGTTNADTAVGAASASLPQTAGNRLGGNDSLGKSRLLDDYSRGGRILGGGARAGKGNPELRDLILKAAESRQRQMLQIRRMIEQSKEPCVIEIFDDDDDDDDDSSNNGKNHAISATGTSQDLNQNPRRKRSKTEKNGPISSQQRRKVSNTEDVCVIDLASNDGDITERLKTGRDGVVLSQQRRKVSNIGDVCVIDLAANDSNISERLKTGRNDLILSQERLKAPKNEGISVIDLTTNDSNITERPKPGKNSVIPSQGRRKVSNNDDIYVVDLATNGSDITSIKEGSCRRCASQNTGSAYRCDLCLGRQYKSLSSFKRTEGPSCNS